MSTILDNRYHKARKNHMCDYCGTPILKGEYYHSQPLVYEGEFYNWKSHLHCDTIGSKLDIFDYNEDGVTMDDFIESIHEEALNISITETGKEDKVWGMKFKEKLDYVLTYHKIDKDKLQKLHEHERRFNRSK